MSFGALAFTPIVKKLQEQHGSRAQYERIEGSGATQDRLTDVEREFLAQRDSFYLATTGATGWPYVQHRGGPKGFLKVIDDMTVAFADLRGNRQYISTGNLMSDDRVAMIFVDYPRQARLKLLGHVAIFEGPQADAWLEQVRMPEYRFVIERVFVIRVAAFDWNCPQHITPRYTKSEIGEVFMDMEQRLRRMSEENKALKAEVERLKANS